jgi:chromosome condensin MukBEF ATPase and DNA-binding subunit MukB
MSLSKTDLNIFAVLYYATRLVERYNRLVEYCEHTRDAREQMLAQSDEGLRQNQEQLFGRHGDFSREAGHWISTNNSLDRALTNDEHGMHFQQCNSATDDRHDAARL